MVGGSRTKRERKIGRGEVVGSSCTKFLRKKRKKEEEQPVLGGSRTNLRFQPRPVFPVSPELLPRSSLFPQSPLQGLHPDHLWIQKLDTANRLLTCQTTSLFSVVTLVLQYYSLNETETNPHKKPRNKNLDATIMIVQLQRLYVGGTIFQTPPKSVVGLKRMHLRACYLPSLVNWASMCTLCSAHYSGIENSFPPIADCP